jgi:hypothetical protein
MPKVNKTGSTRAYLLRVSTTINVRTHELIFLLCASSDSKKQERQIVCPMLNRPGRQRDAGGIQRKLPQFTFAGGMAR